MRREDISRLVTKEIFLVNETFIIKKTVSLVEKDMVRHFALLDSLRDFVLFFHIWGPGRHSCTGNSRAVFRLSPSPSSPIVSCPPPPPPRSQAAKDRAAAAKAASEKARADAAAAAAAAAAAQV